MSWRNVFKLASTEGKDKRDETLRCRVQQINAQIDDLSRNLRIPHDDLVNCVNRILSAAGQQTKRTQSSSK